jgi:primary-amine oxidase
VPLQGPSFSLDGNVLTWQKWRVRLGFNYREGLVLHQVRQQPGCDRKLAIMNEPRTGQ